MKRQRAGVTDNRKEKIDPETCLLHCIETAGWMYGRLCDRRAIEKRRRTAAEEQAPPQEDPLDRCNIVLENMCCRLSLRDSLEGWNAVQCISVAIEPPSREMDSPGGSTTTAAAVELT